MKRFQFLEPLLFGGLPQEGDVLRMWRERVLRFILVVGTALGGIAYVASLVFTINNGQWHVLVIYTLVYAGVVTVTFLRRASYHVRVGSILFLTYTLGLVSLLTTGASGYGRVYMFALLTLASVLLGLRAGLFALALGTTTLAIHGGLLGSGLLESPAAPTAPFGGVFWVYSIAVFVLLGAVSAVPLAVLVGGLESALRNEKTLTRQLEEEIGERKRAERDLQRQMRKLRDTQAQLLQSAKLAAVGELAAGVAHELSNPLTSILGYADLVLEDTAPDSPSREDLKKVIAEARRARGVVQNLFSFSQQTKPKRESADVNEILQRTMAVVRYQLETSGIVVEEEHDTRLRPLLLDAGQMSQVFLNLISNAIRAMPEGGRLSVRTAQVGDEVAVAISDTGEGIPLQIQDRLFDPFFITGSAGTGVGLSVSLRVVEEHGGRITVESEEGRGSTFTVWLPMK